VGFETLFKHRVGIFATYYEIAKENEQRYLELDAELDALEARTVSEDGSDEYIPLAEKYYSKRQQAAVIAITFAALCLEAFFYDYAAEKMGDGFAEKHLDNLDPKSKFLVYPRLGCGRAPDKGSNTYRRVHDLFVLRNKLVHFKSKAFDLREIQKAGEHIEEFNQLLRGGVDNAIKCVNSVMEEMDRLHESGKFYRSQLEVLYNL
jgi:hypothetical protein